MVLRFKKVYYYVLDNISILHKHSYIKYKLPICFSISIKFHVVSYGYNRTTSILIYL